MEYILEARNITKRFPGTTALDDVSVFFSSGKVHAIIGKNGSGKSTLMKIFSGVYEATSGELYLYDKRIEHNSPVSARENGIATVYQELSLVGDLTVGENIFLGRLPLIHKNRIDWNAVYRRAKECLGELGVSIDVKEMVRKLPVGQQQLVEIAKAMSFSPKVLILDEPTSALSDTECEKLFAVVRKLREKGIIILFISHRLQELYKIADTVTALRDGVLVGTAEMFQVTPEDIVKMMFGSFELKTKPRSYVVDEEVLSIEKLNSKKFKNIDFKLKKGEILGIAGMMGSGRTEILRAIYGLDKFDSGAIVVNGKKVESNSIKPHLMKNLGVGYTSENRKEEGLCLSLSIGVNLCLACLKAISPNNRISKKIENYYVERQVDGLQIKISSPDKSVMSLSGGNQQKVVLGNWLNTQANIIFLDEPSRGIDVNAKSQIFSIIWEEAAKGKSFIMVSSELEELIETCDRIIILRQGEIKGKFDASLLTVEALYSKCMEVN